MRAAGPPLQGPHMPRMGAPSVGGPFPGRPGPAGSAGGSMPFAGMQRACTGCCHAG